MDVKNEAEIVGKASDPTQTEQNEALEQEESNMKAQEAMMERRRMENGARMNQRRSVTQTATKAATSSFGKKALAWGAGLGAGGASLLTYLGF